MELLRLYKHIKQASSDRCINWWDVNFLNIYRIRRERSASSFSMDWSAQAKTGSIHHKICSAHSRQHIRPIRSQEPKQSKENMEKEAIQFFSPTFHTEVHAPNRFWLSGETPPLKVFERVNK